MACSFKASTATSKLHSKKVARPQVAKIVAAKRKILWELKIRVAKSQAMLMTEVKKLP